MQKTLELNAVSLNANTLFLLSTSGSQSSLRKHNEALGDLGVNIVYFTFDRRITPKEYSDLLRSPIVRGGAVTGQGLKTGMIMYLDKVDELAKSTQAVNTVVNKGGVLYGYNTDAYGFETALQKHLRISGIKIKKAVIYGNGGVSGVASHVLTSMGIQVTMIGRNLEKVRKKMHELKLTQFEGPYDLVVNATPVSSEKLEDAIGLLDTLKRCKVVFDHNMPEKDGRDNYLQTYCKEHRIYFIGGKEMYNPQMIKQWKLFLNGFKIGDSQLKLSDEDIVKSWKLNDTKDSK